MNGKSKKSKHKKKLSDDLPDIHDYKKEIFKNDNNNNRQHRSDSDTRNSFIEKKKTHKNFSWKYRKSFGRNSNGGLPRL